MLRNGDVILKNGDNIFKSQVVDSYINMNSCYLQYLRLTTTGLSETEPLQVYYETPTAILKTTYTADLSNSVVSFPVSADNCVKNYYFCGNTDSVELLCGYATNIDGKFSGNLTCAMSQFPNLEVVDFHNREVDFNNDLSYTTFPRNLCVFRICDRGIQGDLSTIKNAGSVKCWCLTYPPFSGNFHDIDFDNSLCYTNFRYTYSLSIDLNTLTDNNTGYTYSCFYQTPGTTLCADTLDISNLTYIDWYIPNLNVKGTWSAPDFNTGITRFNITTCCVNMDLTDWDISDTQLTCFVIRNNYGNYGSLSGSLSGWTMPSTLEAFYIDYGKEITDVPTNWSGDTPNLLRLSLQNVQALSGDVTTWIIPSGLTTLAIYYSSLIGNLEEFDIPSTVTSIQLRNSCFTGALANIVLPTGSSQYYLDGNFLTGNAADISIYSPQSYYDVSNNDNVYLDLNTPFDTCNLYGLYLDYISGITGSFNNLTVGDTLQNLCMSYTPVESNPNDLDLNNIRYLYMTSTSLSQDITPMFTGTTNLYTLCMNNNLNLSGDTTNWNLDDVRNIIFTSTALDGRFSHACPYCLHLNYTNICSCIETDFDFSIQSYNISLCNSKVQGNLSGVTLYYANTYQFMVNGNPDVYGANCFSNDIFVNRKNFGRSYINLWYNNIGDYVTGTSETLGDLGTWGGSEWDLTEAQVNNLAAGTDYNGGGSNTPWSERNKIYWVKNAFESGGVTKRYPTFNINYSYN